jgi:hypothetical protein
MRAWYKPQHEPDPAVGHNTTAEDYARELRRLDRHDLKILRDFWRKETNIIKQTGGLDVDFEVAQQKLARLNAEIERRNALDV